MAAPGPLSHWLAKQIILASQRTPRFAARGGYSRLDANAAQNELARSEIEYGHPDDLLANLDGFDFTAAIRGKTVLDFGSGFGGRSVWMAHEAAHVTGIEIGEEAVELSKRFAAAKGLTNTEFVLGREDRLAFPDGAFDVVVSFDVLEHVQRPDVILPELSRVLRPGGTAILILTPYFGMFAHHLNYITLAPALHWFFSPEVLVDVVNELLRDVPAFQAIGMPPQPAPHPSYNGKRLCLPTLNGLTKPEYLDLAARAGFEIRHVKATRILDKYALAGGLGRAANEILARLPRGDELFATNLVSILSKPGG